MTQEKIKIGTKSYVKPDIKTFNRKALKEFNTLGARMSKEEDTDLLWDMLASLIPQAPQKDIDTLTLGEIIEILESATGMSFGNGGPTEDPEITMGESSASTNS